MRHYRTSVMPSFLLSFLMVGACAGSAFAQTADEVVNKYLAAIGGREALGKLHTRKATGTVSVAVAAGVLSGPIEVYSKAPNKTHQTLRLDLTSVGGAGEMTVDLLFDGEKGYSLNSMQGDSEVSPRQLAAMRNNVFPTPLLDYKAAGFTLAVLPREVVNGRDTVVLQATPKSGEASKIFFDAATYLVVRTVTTVDSATGGDMQQTSDVSDYRTIDGIKMPFKIVNTNDLQTVTITLATVEHNISLDDAMFVKK
jgi:outer membrane lipoprotein-sorting protein